MRFEIVIDDVVLNGADPRDRHRIGDAIERHLTSSITASAIGRVVQDAPNREKTVSDLVTRSVSAAVNPSRSRGR